MLVNGYLRQAYLKLSISKESKAIIFKVFIEELEFLCKPPNQNSKEMINNE